MSLPIKVRLTAWYVMLLGVLLLALGVFLLVRLRSDLVSGIDRSLDARAAQLELGGESTTGESDLPDLGDTSAVAVRGGEVAAQLISASGRIVEAGGDVSVAGHPLIGRAELARAASGGIVRATTILGRDREPFRVLAVRIEGSRRVLAVAESLEQVDRSVHRLLVLMLLAGPAVLAAAGAGGWGLARKALRPVSTMTEEAAAIGVDRLDERIAVPGTSDEIERLGRTLNAMLDRLERGVAEKRGFLADASHELRTPLAVMRAEIDVSLRSGDVSPAAREVLESSAEEVDRMTAIVEDLLTLARIDEGRMQLLRAPVPLGTIAEDVAGKLRPIAEAKGLRLDVSGDGATVEGDHERLRQAVTNLVDNAVKFTPSGGRIRIASWHRNRQAGITVTDSGPGIPSDALPRIFERFVRVDHSRSRDAGGSGLGLAICREIVEAHGGSVWAESDPGRGSSFSLSIPESD
ncbi:MAG: sensor histidine kinase [Actinomycetota bacterium]